MNPSQQIPDPAADEEAALWAARLEGSQLGAAERAELDSWLGRDVGRRALLSDYLQFSADLDCLLPELAHAGRVEMPAEKAPVRVWWTPRWVAAGALTAAALAAAALWLVRSDGRPEKIATSVAQRRSFTLADGTRVELNANTSMLVENGRAERRVRLADGEAFFIVSKDKSRPFIVETPAGSVRVTGTIFNVRTEAASQLEVTVVEGSVQVRPGEASGGQSSGPVILGAGDRLFAGSAGVSLKALSAGALDDALAWRQGKIVCDGMPLADALDRFAHYNGWVLTATAGAAGNRVGGIYSLDDPDGFLASLGPGFNLKVTHELGGAVRVSLPTEP